MGESNIKGLLGFAIVLAACVYGYGSFSFREAGVYQLLDGWNDATRRGDAAAMCDSFTDDMTFSIRDHAGAKEQHRDGGRTDFCEYLDKFIPLYGKAVKSMDTTRSNFSVTRHLWHPWTAEVSYTEHLDTTLTVGTHLKQASEDHLTLFATLKGLRVKHLESDSRVALAQ